MEVIGMDGDFQAVEPMEICYPEHADFPVVEPMEICSPEYHIDFQAVEPMEICLPEDHVPDVEMMEVDEIEDKMEVDEDIQDIRYILGGGMNTQQQQASPFLRAGFCQNVEKKYHMEITSRDKRFDHLNDQLQHTEMIRNSEISKLRQHCVNAEMDFKKSESAKMEFESEIAKKNEKIVFLSSQLELKSDSIGELMSDFDATNNELLSMNKAISILLQEKQDFSRQSFEQCRHMSSRIAHLQQELRSKESKINEMFVERKADLLKLGQMEKQIKDLNQKNQKLKVENLRQPAQNEMERKIFHQDSSSTQNNTSSIDLDFAASISLPCEDLFEVEYVKGTQLACQTNNQGKCTHNICISSF